MDLVKLFQPLIKIEESGAMPANVKENSAVTVGSGTGTAVSHAAWFKVTAVHPLI